MGRIGSGKTTACHSLASKYGLRVASFSTYVRAEAKDRGITPMRASLQDLGLTLFRELGADALLEAVLRSVRIDAGTWALVDGIRHVSVYDALRHRSAANLVMFLQAAPKTRLDRCRERALKDGRVLTEVEFQQWDSHEIESGIDGLIAVATVVVDTSYGVKATHDTICANLERSALLPR